MIGDVLILAAIAAVIAAAIGPIAGMTETVRGRLAIASLLASLASIASRLA